MELQDIIGVIHDSLPKMVDTMQDGGIGCPGGVLWSLDIFHLCRIPCRLCPESCGVMPENDRGIGGLQCRAHNVINPELLLFVGRVVGLSSGHIRNKNASSIISSMTTNTIPM